MRYSFILFVLLFPVISIWAETSTPKVPSSIEFADMHLKLTDDARKEIQKEVDALTQSEKYYQIKADRIKLYFPIIEKVFRQEGVPEDFKYLAVQESALISDAVSSAKAVGFWQFKDFTGREVGLRIDKRIDERLNVVSSTIGVSKYFKRHNFYFDNWVYTLLAHMTGRGGAEPHVDQNNFGKKRLTIDRNTHWYIKRFLSHLIAFRDADQGKHSEGLKLTEFKKAGGLTLRQIADRSKTDFSEVKRYNKWLKSGSVPKDKTYTVLLPSNGKNPKVGKIENTENIVIEKPEIDTASYTSIIEDPSTGTIFIKINGISCVLAAHGDDMVSLAEKGSIRVTQFAKYNDMDVNDQIREGDIYYLKPKHNKANSYFHAVDQGEDLWLISQKFGIKLSKLAKLNRMELGDDLEVGRVLWLRNRRPDDIPVEVRSVLTAPVAETVNVEEIVKRPKYKSKAVFDTVKVKNSKDEQISIEVPDEDIEVVIVNHVVVAGESLYAISRNYEVEIQELVEWNDLKDYNIGIDQVLKIHTVKKEESNKEQEEEFSPNEPDEIIFHVVEPGDTMYGIARKYDVPVKELLDLNQKENFDLKVGERIKLKP